MGLEKMYEPVRMLTHQMVIVIVATLKNAFCGGLSRSRSPELERSLFERIQWNPARAKEAADCATLISVRTGRDDGHTDRKDRQDTTDQKRAGDALEPEKHRVKDKLQQRQDQQYIK